MPVSKLKIDNNVLKVGNNILTIDSEDIAPALDINPETMPYTNLQAMPVLYDSSGNEIHGFQPVSARQGIYKTNQVNGLPVFETDGIDDNWWLPYAVKAKSVFVVVKSINGTTRQGLFGNPLVSWQFSSNADSTYFSTNDSINYDTNVASSAAIHGMPQYDYAPYNKVFIDGDHTPVAIGSVPYVAGQWKLYSLRIEKSDAAIGLIGSEWRAGPDGSNGDLYGKFQYARVIVYDRLLPTLQELKIRNELINKYGL